MTERGTQQDAVQTPLFENLITNGEEGEEIEALRSWWQRDVFIPFSMKAQAWINDQGSRIASNAGINVESESHAMGEDSAGAELQHVLSSSNGYHFKVDDIVDRAKTQARELERMSNIGGWSNGFLVEFVDILSRARELSPSRQAKLKTLLLKPRLPNL